MAERRGDGPGGVVLPCLRLESDDAPALLDDRHVGVTVAGAAGAQVIDRQADRLGRRHAEFARHTHDRGDPDLPASGSGNPPSYEAIRTKRSLYVEYVTGEREYYDLRRDPFELHNLAATLSRARLRRLHRTLAGIEACHGGRSCWRAQHGATGAA